jgi:hypothetical protein
MVKKYLWPWIELVDKGPQMSKWTSSNLDLAIELVILKGSFFYFAKWQISQVALLWLMDKVGYNWVIVDNLEFDKKKILFRIW